MRLERMLKSEFS